MTRKNFLLAATTCASALMTSVVAQAAGTGAASLIENNLSVRYQVDGVDIDLPDLATDSFAVDEIVSFSLAPLNDPAGLSVDPDQDDAPLVFILTNTGNATRSFDIDLAVSDSGAPIDLSHDPSGSADPGSYSIYLSDTSSGPGSLYDPAALQGTPSIAPDASIFIRVVSQIPADAADKSSSIFAITARPMTSTGDALETQSTAFSAQTTEVLFGDEGANGIETDSDFYLVASATVSASKTITIASENRDGSFSCAITADEGGSALIPGACVNYIITLSNAASASENATDFSFADALPSGLIFKGVRSNDGFDEVRVSGGVVTGTVDDMPPGGQASLTIRAEIE